MSDAAFDQNTNSNQIVATASCCSLTSVEEHWRRGIILVQIWREVLRVILFAGEQGEGLDEKSKREMWLLLVAAGSGYLARCWHKTLKPKPQLTDHPHDGDHASPGPNNREEDPLRPVDTLNNLLTSSSPPLISQLLLEGPKETPVDAARIRKTPELAPKPLRRSFSPKALGRKLFSSEANKIGKSPKKESPLSSPSARVVTDRIFASADGPDRESNRSTASGGEKSLSQDAAASVGERSNSNRRSPWSSFRSHSFSKAQAREGSPGAADEDDDSSGESSPGCLRRAGDSFRKSRKKSDNGSLSSRSLQGILGGDGGDVGPASVGSSRREMDPGDSVYSFSGLADRSLSSLGTSAAQEMSEPSTEVGDSPEVTSRRKAAAENEAKSSSPDVVSQNSSRSSSAIRKEAPSNSVAAVVAKIEKENALAKAETVNAILSLRAANQAQAQAVAAADIVKVRKLKLEILEQNSQVEAEILPGGKGKRRAGDGGGKAGGGNAGGKLAGIPDPLSTGKRTKDSKNLNKSDSSGVKPRTTSGKWRKDASFVPEDTVGDFEEASTFAGLEAMDLSHVFFGFDSTFLGSSAEEKSPFRFHKRSKQFCKSGRSNMRKMRESPRPVSALESCLRAQFPERDNEGSRVARSLNFSSSSVSRRGQRDGGESLDPSLAFPFSKYVSDLNSPASSSDGRGLGGGSEQQSPQQTGRVLGLPMLITPSPQKWSASRGGFSSERGHNQVVESKAKYPRKVVLEDRGRVVSGQSKLSDVLWRPTTLPVALKKRKVSQACSPSANNSTHLQTRGYELEALVIPPMEGLLFCFGVGIGVMSSMDEPDENVERLSRELQMSQEKIENLNNLLSQARESSAVQTTELLSEEIIVAGPVSSEEVVTVEVIGTKESPLDPQVTPALESPLDPLSVTPAIEETERQFDLYRREAPETPQQSEHMAELEAELEAELDALTSSITDVAGGPPDFAELDPEGVAGVADRDLGVEGLPAVVDWDDDNDDFIAEEPVHSGGGVPPRELSRLLRKVQNSRQEHRITELEADLQEAVEKLQKMEKELQLLRKMPKSFTLPPSADSVADSSDSDASSVPDDLFQSDKSSWSAKIERLNQNVFEDQEKSRREEASKSGVGTPDRNTEDKHKLSVEHSSTSLSAKQEHGSNVMVSVASEPASSLGAAVDSDSISQLLVRAESDPLPQIGGSAASEFESSVTGEYTSSRQESASVGTRSISHVLAVAAAVSRSGSSAPRSISFSSMDSMNSEAQADNDAVCDEFLSSVFCSPDGSQLGLGSVMSSPLTDLIRLSNTPEVKSEASVIPVQKDVPLETVAPVVGEDLDQVVGQLLKKDSSSVKNAINAFLRWEAAEKDDAPSKDDMGEEEASSGNFSRRTAGKYPTPQKTPVLSSVPTSVTTPQKSSIITARLEELRNSSARSAFTSERMPYAEKPFGNPRRLVSSSDEKSPGRGGGKAVDAFLQQQIQASLAKLEDKSSVALGLWEYPVPRKDHSPQITPRRGEAPAGKVETPLQDSVRDLYRGESPVFGGGDRDFQALLDTRRELRYSSGKIQLSLAGQDTAPVFRQRDDPSRAGTNSPVGRPPTRNPFQSPKVKHSRMAFEHRLYQNPTSDWLSEVGSPPDLE